MDELADLLQQILAKLSDISDSLGEISDKLDNIDSSVGLVDSAVSLVDLTIGNAVSDIVGETRYNLTDIHNDLSEINSTLIMKD